MAGKFRPLLVIVGPTATGKTDAAIALARRYDGELIGADSVQVYTGFDIGSAKPSADELDGLPHHLINVTTPDRPIDAVDYARLADAAIAEVHQRGQLPIVVGGTGLWIRALLRGLIETPKVDPQLRQRLESDAAALTPAALHAQLNAIDPLAAARIHPNDRVRILRALEVYEQTGVPLGQLQKAHALGQPRYSSLNIALDLDRPTLYQRIRDRTERMIERGWITECQALVERYGPLVRPLSSVGYRQLLMHILHNEPLELTKQKIIKATQIYTRRQRTWFRGEPDFSWWTTSSDVMLGSGCQKIDAYLAQRGML